MNYLSLKILIPHEKIEINNLSKIKELVKQNKNLIFKPIIVDKNSSVVLDWHHRLETAKQLNIEKIPVILVDYLSENLILKTDTWLTKKEIINNALKWKLLEPKSTFHYIIKNWEEIHISDYF